MQYDVTENIGDEPHVIFVNGTVDDAASADDAASPVAQLDVSAGSDTDNSKAEILGQRQDGKVQHTRSSSMKKPASFRPVSVTKNFLAKTATATLILRTGEKSMYSASSMSAV